MRRPVYYALPLLLALVGGGLAAPTATAVEPPVIVEPARAFDTVPVVELGRPVVGQKAHAKTIGTWAPAVTRLRFRWYLDDVYVGSSGDAQWPVPQAYLGHRLRVDVEASRDVDGDLRASTRSTSAVVTLPRKRTVRIPPLVVNADAGIKSWAVLHGVWSPAPDLAWGTDARLTYQWLLNGKVFRSSSADDVVVPRTAMGKRLQTRVILDEPGFERAVATSRPSIVAGLTYTRRGYPDIESFLPEVGKTVRAKIDAWSPRPTRFTYQWLLNSKPIKGATTSRLKITKRMKGKFLQVVVTAHRQYYRQTSTRSAGHRVYGPNLS